MIPVIRYLSQQDDVSSTFHAVPGSPAAGALTTANMNFDVLNPWASMEEGVSQMEHLLKTLGVGVAVAGISTEPLGSEKCLLQAAVNLHIPTVVMVESWPNAWLGAWGWRDLPLYRQATRVCAVDEVAVAAFLKYEFSPGAISTTGNPLNDALAAIALDRDSHRKNVRERLGISSNDLVLLWATMANLDNPAEDNPEHPIYWLGYSERQLIHEFLATVRDCNASNEAQIHPIVRIKPSYDGKAVREIIEQVYPQASFDKDPKLGGAPTILTSDCVFGTATLALENAARLGVPVVSVLPNYGDRPIPVLCDLGLSLPVCEEGGLSRLISWIAKSPEKILAPLRKMVGKAKAVPGAAEKVSSLIRIMGKI